MPAAAIPLAVGAIGAIGSGIAGAAGVGKNKTQTKDFYSSGQYDPNAFEYGGRAGGAEAAAGGYDQRGLDAQGRTGPQVNYADADQWQRMGLNARTGQSAVADQYMQRAMGGPTIAQNMADRQMGQAMAQQRSLAGSARSAGGMALAQQNAANNVANSAQDISGQAQINGAQEQLGYLNAAGGMFGQMRQGDATNQNMSAQQQQFQSQLEANQRAQNDQYALGMANNAIQVRNAQLNAQGNRQNLQANSYNQVNQLNQQKNQANAQREMEFFKAGLGSVMGGVQGASGAGMGGKMG